MNSVTQIEKDMKRNQSISFLSGAFAVAAAELIQDSFFPDINIWKVRGMFIPIACVGSVFAILSSSIIRTSLKKYVAYHPVVDSEKCIEVLIAIKNDNAWDLFKQHSKRSIVFVFCYGIAAAIVVASFFHQ